MTMGVVNGYYGKEMLHNRRSRQRNTMHLSLLVGWSPPPRDTHTNSKHGYSTGREHGVYACELRVLPNVGSRLYRINITVASGLRNHH